MIEGIVGLHGVPGRNESGGRLLEMYAEQELVVGLTTTGDVRRAGVSGGVNDYWRCTQSRS